MEVFGLYPENIWGKVNSINRAANRLSLSIIAASLIIGGKFVWDNFPKASSRGKNKRR